MMKQITRHENFLRLFKDRDKLVDFIIENDILDEEYCYGCAECDEDYFDIKVDCRKCVKKWLEEKILVDI